MSKGNAVSNAVQFVKDSKKELKKVSWPTRKQTSAVTMVTIIAVFIAGFYLATVDWALSEIIKYIIR